MNQRLPAFAVIVLVLLLTACGREAADESTTKDAPPFLVVDTHIDVPYRLKNHYEDVSGATAGGDFDYPRALAGGLNVAFMSVYVPAEKQQPGTARTEAEATVELVENLAKSAPEKFGIAFSTAQALELVAQGKIALAMGMENGAGLEEDLGNVAYFFGRGIRYVTLTHSKANLICDSSYDGERPWGGLSPYGRQVVEELNRVGIMVDVSHITDDAFNQVMDISTAPVIASHSSARHFTPGFERNMSDQMIQRLAGAGGVIQINFGSSFLTAEANKWYMEFQAAEKAWEDGFESAPSEEQMTAMQNEYRAVNSFPYASLEDVLDHIDHVVRLGGVDHVGIGSDFDGVGDSLPVGLKDVSAYPALISGLRGRGYSDEDIRKIMGGNLMRVWRAVEEHASHIRESAT
jgi:membrane dipeptidase